MSELFKHYEANKELFDFWIERREKLQIGMAILKPLVEEFKKQNPGMRPDSCADCVIDVVIWAKIQYKNELKKQSGETVKATKPKKTVN